MQVQVPFAPTAKKAGIYIYLLLSLTLLLFSRNGDAQTPAFRIVAYNLLNYDIPDTALRNPEFRTIMPAINADLVVTTEMVTAASSAAFLNKVLNENTASYAMAPFIDGPDSDPSLYYRSSIFQHISSTVIPTALRNIVVYTVRYIPTGDTIRIAAVHLKASTGTTNEAARAAEVDSLRKYTNTLPAGSNFIVCGDFNLYASTESAYQKLLAVTAGNEGQFYDPITLTGSWNQSIYAAYHTQSPRVRAFGGGSTGGMDDRFDLVLHSKALRDSIGLGYKAGSLTAFGNDGNHYNDSINRSPNAAVSQAIANALHNAADHIPVYADYVNYGSVILSTINVSAQQLTLPTLSSCSVSGKNIGISVKNNSVDTLKFSQNPMTLSVTISSQAGTEYYSTIINSGLLAPSVTQDYTVVNNYNFLSNTNYSISGKAKIQGNTNVLNDTIQPVIVTTPQSFTTSITTSTNAVCQNETAQLTATNGISWSWSTSATTQKITVGSGTYNVTATDANGCTANAVITINSIAAVSTTIFSENMGSVSTTTSIASHEQNNGFQNVALTMSGTGDVRNTNTSSSYSGASGNANIFLTNATGRNFIVSGINTSNYTNITLTFGVFKSTTTGNGSDLEISYSLNGTTYTTLSMPALPASTGWFLRTVSGSIPATANLRIQFRQTGTATQYRIDDVLLTGNVVPKITASATSFCNGDSVLLQAGTGQRFAWSTGATTATIYAKNAGAYTVSVDCIPSDSITLTTQNCALSHLQLKCFIQGFYIGSQQMSPVLYLNGFTSNPDAVDTITLNFYSSATLSLSYTTQAILKNNGIAILNFPASLNGNLCYIELRHRNSLAVWTKNPVLLSTDTYYNFSQ